MFIGDYRKLPRDQILTIGMVFMKADKFDCIGL